MNPFDAVLHAVLVLLLCRPPAHRPRRRAPAAFVLPPLDVCEMLHHFDRGCR